MIRKIRAAVAYISFLMLLGTVGGMEHDRMPLHTGLIICAICLVAFAWGSSPFRYWPDAESEVRNGHHDQNEDEAARSDRSPPE